MNGVLGHNSAFVKLYWAGANLGPCLNTRQLKCILFQDNVCDIKIAPKLVHFLKKGACKHVSNGRTLEQMRCSVSLFTGCNDKCREGFHFTHNIWPLFQDNLCGRDCNGSLQQNLEDEWKKGWMDGKMDGHPLY